MNDQAFNGVRDIDSDELGIVRDLRIEMLTDAPEAFGTTLTAETEPSFEQWREIALKTQWFGAFVMGLPVGLSALEQCPNHAELEISSVWLAPAQRRSGLADQLIEVAEAAARRIGERTITLWVLDGNPAAQKFYKRLGYYLTGEYEPVPHDPSRSSRQLRRSLG